MKLNRILRKALVTLVVLLGFGLARTPYEDGLTRRLVESGLIAPVPAGGLGGMIGQSTFLAVLGGLRPLVGIYTTLHAFDAWSYKNWDTVERDYVIITTLLPEDIDSWKTGAWHMTANAWASNLYDHPELSETERELEARRWVLKGVEFLKRGIEQNPDSAALHHELADVYRERLDEPCLAARHYRLSLEGDHPKSFVRRFYGYYLARCPGREREAYDYLMDLYHESPSHRLPTLIQRIKELEPKLDIPEANRIPDPDPDVMIRKRFPNAQLP